MDIARKIIWSFMLVIFVIISTPFVILNFILGREKGHEYYKY